MQYNEIRTQLKTGDIVLFSGSSPISHGIKLLTFSKWSHIGMVFKLPEIDTIFLWEATTGSNIADAIDGKIKHGVRLVLLSERIQTYQGEVAIRQLNGFDMTQDQHRSLMQLRNQLKNKRYEENELELMKSAFDGPFGTNQEDLSSLFCSELVAEAYQCLGLLDESIPSNEYIPKDFAEKKPLKLRSGAYLGEEIALI